MPAAYTYTNYSLPTPVSTMSSSTAFRQQVTQLLSDLTRCYELCDAILTNRRLGSTHESFDRLQDGLKSSASEIQLQFNLLRKVIGSKMDQGDDKARSAMETSVRDTQMEIRAKLFDVAYKRRDGRNSPELPGFRELLRRWRMIEREVTDTLQSLGQRLEEKKSDKKADDKKKTTAKTYEVKSTADPYDPYEQEETEQVTIRLQDLDTLLKHMKNSWVEKWVGGDILYINKFDSAKTQWEKPTGYIKHLPRSSRRSSETSSRDSRGSRRSSAESWELPQRRRTTRDDIWHDPNGW
jgi:hypothetical protein